MIWPIPLLALNIYQYRALGTEQAVSSVLGQKFGMPTLSGVVIVGTLVYLLYNRLLWGTGIAIQWERQIGTIESLFLSPTSRLTVLLGTGMAAVVEASWWIGSIFAISWVIFGFQATVSSLLLFFLVLFSTILALTAVGIFFAGFFVMSRAGSQIATASQAPIRFFSGVAFPVAALPQVLQLIALVIPVTYAIQALRKVSLLSTSLLDISWELGMLYALTAVFLAAGVYLVRLTERKAKTEGTLYEL